MTGISRFNVLRWAVPDTVKHLSPNGIKVLKFEKRDIAIIWFKNVILIYDNINLCKLQNRDTIPGSTIVLSVEGTIMNILQLGDVVGVFNGCSLYLLVKTSDKSAVSMSSQRVDVIHKGSMALKMHMKMHQEVLAICMVFMGFVLVKKKHGKLYVDVYKTGPRMVPAEKIFSVQLPESAYSDVSCTLTSARCGDLDPALASLLLEDLALVSSQVIFVGLDCGQVYCVPVVTESRSAPVVVPKILYSTTQPIARILCIRDSVTCLYSHVGIVLRSGPVVYITSNQQKLSYHMVYLPVSVEGCCPVKDGIMATDGLDLWHSKLTWSSEGQPVVENRVMGIKGVCAFDLVPDSDVILVITLHLTLYSVQLGTKMSVCQPQSFTVPPSIMADMDKKMQHLTRLKQQMTVEEKMLEAISISRRDKLLQNSFMLSVQVYGASKSTDAGQYAFEIHLKNNEDQDYCPETWSLHVSVTTEGMSVNQTTKLEQRIRKGVSLKTLIMVNIPKPFTLIQVSCSLVSKISEEGETEATFWAVIPIAVTTLDISYFFSPFSQSTKSSLSEDLLKIAHSHMGENMKRPELEHSREPVQHVYEFKLLREWATPSDIWAAVVKNCRHLFTEVMTGRELHLYVGCHLIKLLLNEECSVMQLTCGDVKLLHHIKHSLDQLLKEASNTRKPVLINRTILSVAQKLKADAELEGKNLNLLRDEWRGAVASHLPL